MYRTGDLVRWGSDGQLPIWVAPMSRSRSAGIASNSVRCRRHWPEWWGESGSGDRPRGSAGRQTAGGLRHRHSRSGGDALGLTERLPVYMVPAAVVAIEALPLTAERQARYRAAAGPEYQDVDRYRAPATRSRRSWPASTPRCSGSSGSGSTTHSSSSAGTASCRCRWWRGPGRRGACVGRAMSSSNRPWRGWPGWLGMVDIGSADGRRGRRAWRRLRSCAG